jgi:protein CLEC16A
MTFRQLDAQLNANATITDQNKDKIIECLRSLTETIVWGDQNDQAIFDYFLEKNMLAKIFKLLA